MNQSTYKNPAKKPMAAGALFFNDKDELLIVKPTYREGWLIPGGMVNEHESPWAACVREVKEELGLDLVSHVFLGVDYKSHDEDRGEGLHFIFYGGVLAAGQITGIVLQTSELSEYRFVALTEAKQLLHPRLAKKIIYFLEAHRQHTPVYLENGELVMV